MAAIGNAGQRRKGDTHRISRDSRGAAAPKRKSGHGRDRERGKAPPQSLSNHFVIPAKAGIQRRLLVQELSRWIPAFAG